MLAEIVLNVRRSSDFMDKGEAIRKDVRVLFLTRRSYSTGLEDER